MRSFSSKALSLFAGLSFLVVPLFAQHSEKAPSDELSRLRQQYVDSLKGLLQQYTKDNDIVRAGAVSDEMNKIATASVETTPNSSPCGRWRFDGNTVLIVTPDGIATNVQNKGIWRWTDQAARQLQIEWRNGYVDKVTVSPDGTAMLFVNNLDKKFFAYRLPDKQGSDAVSVR